MPDLIFVVGCNAAGKSTFIRTRLNDLEEFEVFMTDVYKHRTKELVKQAINEKKNVLVETVFNDASFKDLADLAKIAGYTTSLVVLFLDSIQQSINRVAFRGMQQSGITISGSNVRINFNESFKNIANYFFYFDRSDFIYTGEGEINRLIMSFHNGDLLNYSSNSLVFPQNFAKYSFGNERLNDEAYHTITANNDFIVEGLTFDKGSSKFEL